MLARRKGLPPGEESFSFVPSLPDSDLIICFSRGFRPGLSPAAFLRLLACRGAHAKTRMLLFHRQLHVSVLSELNRFFVTRIGMADDAHSRIGRQDALNAFGHHFGPVGHRHLAGV